eukprot:1717160-Rhodomonas_salina.1
MTVLGVSTLCIHTKHGFLSVMFRSVMTQITTAGWRHGTPQGDAWRTYRYPASSEETTIVPVKRTPYNCTRVLQNQVQSRRKHTSSMMRSHHQCRCESRGSLSGYPEYPVQRQGWKGCSSRGTGPRTGSGTM